MLIDLDFFFFFFFFKQKTAYEITHSDWSSDVCSSDLVLAGAWHVGQRRERQGDRQPGHRRRSEERRVGKDVRCVDLGGGRIIKKKKTKGDMCPTSSMEERTSDGDRSMTS